MRGANGQGRIADRLEQRHLFGCQPRRLVRAPRHEELKGRPRHGDGQRGLVACRAAQPPQFLERAGDAVTDTEGGDAQHGAGRNAHGGTVRVVVGQRVGDVAGPLPTDPRRDDVTVGRPRASAHVPGVCGMVVACGLQMFGDKRGVLVGRFRVTLLDGRCQSPVHLDAIGFQL